MEVRCYILISNISGSVKVAPLQILQFPVILPHKFQDAEKFNLQFSDFSEITETADKLRWLRYQKGLRQRDVADYAGIYRSTYIHYEEYGKDFYSPKHMEKIAQLFEVPVDMLLDDYNLFHRKGQGNQIKAIRSFISQQVDYIVLSPIEETGWDTVLQEAKDAGIPVILMDRTVEVADDSLYTTWVGSDFIREGQDAGYWLEDYLKEQGRDEDEINIVVLQGTKGATATIGRTRGFNETAKIQHNWNILEQVDGEFTTAKGKEEMARLLEKYEDIDVVVSQNDDMTFGALEAIHAAGKTTGVNGDITVISFDAVDAGVELVRNGEINIDVQCNPDQGKYVEQVIKDMEAGKEVEKAYYVPERVYTQENAGEDEDAAEGISG